MSGGGPEREAQIINMIHAGQQLAVRWGHQPWSESWARLVAETMLDAADQISDILDAASHVSELLESE